MRKGLAVMENPCHYQDIAREERVMNSVSVPRHDGLLVDMVNESIEVDSNITCDADLNKHVTKIQIQHMMRI